MKAIVCGLFLISTTLVSGQHFNDTNGIDLNFFKGNVLLHRPGLAQLITGHPDGVMVSVFKKTHGHKEWHAIYNYPDYGAYFLYQDFKNDILGKNYAVGAFYNFYFLERHLTLKIGQGIAFTTNPYDRQTNSKNVAFGSKYMGNTNFVLGYKIENIIDKLGFQTGFIFAHFSNGRFKSPNSGINTYSVNMGLNYNLDNQPNKSRDTLAIKINFREPVKYNIALRTGFNESPLVGSGQKPFYHIGFYADKRLNRKSALQLGTELFLTTANKEYIRFRAISFPEDHVNLGTDYKRVGVFIGHELFINRISIETQLGIYVYQPYRFDGALYDRLGMKYYISKQIFTGLSVKTHGFLAEALEVVLGVRL